MEWGMVVVQRMSPPFPQTRWHCRQPLETWVLEKKEMAIGRRWSPEIDREEGLRRS